MYQNDIYGLSQCLCLFAQNVVQYTGSKADREIIRKHEFYFANPDKSKKKRYKFDVLLVSIPTLINKSVPVVIFSMSTTIHAQAMTIVHEGHFFGGHPNPHVAAWQFPE